MADSENSTSISSVTRRRLLAATAVSVATLQLREATAATEMSVADYSFDPALKVWLAWQDAHIETENECRRQQELEARLAETIGFPRVEVHLQDENMTVAFHSQDQINELFGDNPTLAAICTDAAVQLAAHEERWNIADRMLGYSAAKRAEEEAAHEAHKLAEKLMLTPSVTLAGVAGKLDAVLREGESCEGCEEFPWPQIRSALVDLVQIGRTVQPSVFMPGSHRKSVF